MDARSHCNKLSSLEGMANCSYFLQIKWRTTLKNGRLEVVFWKKYILLSLLTIESWRSTVYSETFFGNWRPLKIKENVFYFTVKSPFVLTISKFDLTFLSCRKTALLERYTNFKTYDETTWETTIAIQILSHISRSKGN